MSLHRTLPLALLAIAVAPPAFAANATLSGHVQDANGHALAHVYVHQENGMTSAFSNERGEFTLELDPKGGSLLLAESPGYQPVEIPVAETTQPIQLAKSPAVAVPSETETAETRAQAPADLLNNSFAVRYDWRWQTYGYFANSVAGAVDNELGLDWSARLDNWLWTLDAERSRAAVRVPSLTPSNPNASVLTPETIEGTLELGYALKAGEVEVAPYVAGLWRQVTAGSNGAAVTGTPLDADQTRQAIGLGLQGAKRIAPRLVAFGDLGVYTAPNVTFNNGPASITGLSGLNGAKLKLGLGFDLIPTIRFDLTYRHDYWRATNYAEDADVAMLGISYHPAEVTK
jgi:hypothetical protein